IDFLGEYTSDFTSSRSFWVWSLVYQGLRLMQNAQLKVKGEFLDEKNILTNYSNCGLIFQSAVVFAEGGETVSYDEYQAETVLPLDAQQELQLEFEKKYLDSVFDIIAKHFGDPENFNPYGEIYIENDKFPHFVIAVAKDSVKVSSFIEEIKKILPGDLLEVQRVSYSKEDLINIQGDILQRVQSGSIAIPRGISTDVSTKKQKVIISVPEGVNLEKSYMVNLNEEYNGLIEFDERPENIPYKLRTDAFTEMGGGISIKGTCSTAGIATKDTREFIVTAGHCIRDIGSTVYQGGTSIGTQHLSGYKDNGTDVGLVLLTNEYFAVI
ncbi:S1 family peptidase, partial [Paenibacillus sp. IHBB 10380]|uniref:S1 family peptidase n=3 Tax=Paenibacillus TaxID=44249 RepID=UPI001C930DDB